MSTASETATAIPGTDGPALTRIGRDLWHCEIPRTNESAHWAVPCGQPSVDRIRIATDWTLAQCSFRRTEWTHARLLIPEMLIACPHFRQGHRRRAVASRKLNAINANCILGTRVRLNTCWNQIE